MSGEVRAVSKARQRIDEASRMGFTSIILPKKNFSDANRSNKSIELIPVETVRDALRAAMPRDN